MTRRSGHGGWALPGKGCSTPIVWEDHIVLTAPVEGKDALLAFDWNGRKRWQVVLGQEKPGKHRNGSGSNSSAVTDGSAFFAFFKSKALVAVDFKGKVLWQKDLSSYGPRLVVLGFWNLAGAHAEARGDGADARGELVAAGV